MFPYRKLIPSARFITLASLRSGILRCIKKPSLQDLVFLFRSACGLAFDHQVEPEGFFAHTVSTQTRSREKFEPSPGSHPFLKNSTKKKPKKSVFFKMVEPGVEVNTLILSR